ncbi:hypothetical protein KAR91_29120 [Candidatus Pacearchaeota archaeon]|nr:hypothetical protein [Candidatus Pacearchaeota archaeon]
MLKFTEDTHTYSWNGSKVPGVTTILGEYVKSNVYGTEYYVNTFNGSAVDAEKFRVAADHGNAVHLAIKYLLTDGLDMESLDPSILAAVNQFEAWRDEYVKEIVLVEEPLYSQRYGYAGTPDFVCELRPKYERIFRAKICLTDFKTGAHGLAGPQTAAYETLYKEQSKYRGRILRAVLKLPKDGSDYKFLTETGRQDFNMFKACLFRHNFYK